MPKIFIITFVFAISFSSGMAQDNYADSFKNALGTTSKPSEKFKILVSILEYQDSYEISSIDSSACASLLKIAQEQNNAAMLATAYNWIGYYLLMIKGNNTAALEYYFKALPLAEKINDKRRISSLCFDIANVYYILQNPIEAIKYTVKGGDNLPESSSSMHDYMLVQYQRNMTRYYADARQLDSALYFVSAFTETSYKVKLPNFKYQAMIQNGYLQAQIGEQERAEAYFQKAMALGDSLNADTRSLPFFKAYIPFLISNKRMQDAIFQTQKLWGISQQNNNPNFKLLATGFKRELFERLGQIDSAYYFSRLEADTRDFIFNQNNQNLIQSLAFKEQLRSIEDEASRANYESRLRQYILLGSLGIFTIIALLLYRNNISRKKVNEQLQKQKSEIEAQKNNVEEALSVLKSTQAQLIQSEKMASLGELTAGVAHEIQNPLNFVNNFSEVSKELLIEMKDELAVGNLQLANEIASDVEQNLDKIHHHGKRADAIVKGMLQHSRSSSGQKEPTDLNALCDEYLRLAYHGLKAKDPSFNASFNFEGDDTLPLVNVVPQDIGRVLLNLFNNAFQSVAEQQKTSDENYIPEVKVSTKQVFPPAGSQAERREGTKFARGAVISVSDNGYGIPSSIKDKIFQPFFTTKPTGQGTGLGLSLSYDIVKAHGGELKVETKEEDGSLFIIHLPIN